MMPPASWPPTHTEYDQTESESNQADAEYEEREQIIQNQTPVDFQFPDVAMEYRERQLKRDFTTPLGGSYLVLWIIVILVAIGLMLLAMFLHPL